MTRMAEPLPPPAGVTLASLPLPDPEAYPGEPREYARALMRREDELEAEQERQYHVLRSHGASMNTPLIDPEGYPRADIDVYSIRHAVSAMRRLETDLRVVRGLIETAILAAHAAPPSPPTVDPAWAHVDPSIAERLAEYQARQRLPNGHPEPPAESGATAQPLPNGHREAPEEPWPTDPVARVNSVAPSSPAFQAGLRAGDIIYAFAGVTSEQGLQAIGALVQRSEGIQLGLFVLRRGERKELTLTPRSGWGGRGLLGCHIVPA